MLKTVFDDKDIVAQMQDEANYAKTRKKVSTKFGLAFNSATQTQRNQSIGIRNSGSNDNQDLPDVSNPSYSQPVFQPVVNYLRLYMSGKAQRRALSGSDKASFGGNVAMLTMDITKAYWRDLDFRSFLVSTPSGNKTGCRGVLNNSAYATGSAVTFTIDATTGAFHRRFSILQGIQPGMRLEVYSKTTWTKAADIVVTTTDVAAGTFVGTLSADLAATADEWYLFRQGDFNQDIAGLGDIVDDGTYTSSYATLTTSGLWEGHVLSNSGTLRDFSPSLMDRARLLARKENGDKKLEAWMTYGMYEQVLNYVQRSIVMNKGMGNAPVQANVAGDVEAWGPNVSIKTCAQAPTNEIYIIEPAAIDFLEETPLKPLSLGEREGQFWSRVPGKDNWEAVLVHEFQQRTLRRNLHVKIVDLNQAAY
jgi:hypothetical protein